MITKNTTCTQCGLSMEYWTKNNTIKCTRCGSLITVVPCSDDREVIEGED